MVSDGGTKHDFADSFDTQAEAEAAAEAQVGAMWTKTGLNGRWR